MIKFTALIHKETGTVIKYEDWKEKLEKEHPIKCTNKSRRNLWSYLPKEVLFSDDFEIIYESEFTTEELESINMAIGYFLDSYEGTGLHKEYRKNAEDIYSRLKDKYGIEGEL